MEMMNLKLIILLLGVTMSALAVEDPANCSFGSGGQGNTSASGMNFNLSQAHVGDTVPVFPSFGMVSNACGSIHTTGTVYIATGALTNFFDDLTFIPDGLHSCPTDGLCEPGPYNILITSGLVGVGVNSPNGNVSGTAKRVKTVANVFGEVTSGPVNGTVTTFNSATITIVTPCIQVFEMCGQSCIGSNVNFTGYVLNCGDITLTNVTAVNDRTTLLNLDGSTLSQPFTLTSGQTVQFKGAFTPNGAEIATSYSTNSIVVMGKDTTTIGGPYSSVTNNVTTVCQSTSCNNCSCLCAFN